MIEEKEIPYCRSEWEYSSVDFCPCCGARAEHSTRACQKCFDVHGDILKDVIGGDSIVAARDAFYDLGVRLRAEGKMPPLDPDVLICQSCGEPWKNLPVKAHVCGMVEWMAMRLHATDPRVIEFVRRRGDSVTVKRAFACDEGGWATEARARAEAVIGP